MRASKSETGLRRAAMTQYTFPACGEEVLDDRARATSAGKNVSAPTMTTTPTSSAANSAPLVGNVPGPGGTDLLAHHASRRWPAPG